MKSVFRLLTELTVVALLVSGPIASRAHGQQLRRGTLSGTIVSRAAAVPAGGSVIVYTTPADAFFVLTEVCLENPMGPQVRASGFGKIVTTTSEPCTAMSPGLALPQGSAITAEDWPGGSGTNVVITGVLTTK